MRSGITAVWCVAWLAACEEPPPVEPPEEPPVEEPVPPPPEDDAAVARLPAPADRFAPSHARLAPGNAPDVSLLADVELCEGCHEDVVVHWRAGVHSRSSFDNTWYRSAVDQLRRDIGPEASRLCAGCHDPLLLVSGRIDEPEIAPGDPLAHMGITCLVCHGITETRRDGNGSWTLRTDAVPLPVSGDAASLEAHVDRVRPDPLTTTELCGACHRVFLDEHSGNPHFLPGLDDIGPWRGSVYAGSLAERVDDPVEEKTCQECHMADEAAPLGDAAARGTGTVRSHRFPGGHTALARASGEPGQLEAVRRQLRSAPILDVPALRVLTNPARVVRALPADGARVRPGDRVAFDVLVRNVGAGHFFPGGVRDTQDVWIDLRVLTKDGELVAEAGSDESTKHRLIALMLDPEGLAELRHHPNRFATAAYDHTVPPRGVGVVRYEVDIPRTLGRAAFPLRVEATLRHRRHVPELQRFACAAYRSRRGRQFARASRSFGREPVDPCAEQPLTDLATAAIYVGAGSGDLVGEGGAARSAWRRLWEHGLGVLADVQEHVEDAGPSVERALRLLGDEGTDRERGMLLAARADIAGRLGRADEAAMYAERAEALLGTHPALDRIRGDAFARVWRWPEAEAAYARVTEATPLWAVGWRALAGARGSTMDDEGALEAALRGLELLPRDEWMLRTQSVALEHLGDPGFEEARQAFVAHRRPDHEQELRFVCDRRVPYCARQRVPVPTITMRAAGLR